MLPFWISIGLLSLTQGTIVALPQTAGAGWLARLARLRDRRWALIPPLSVIGFVLIAGAAERASAKGLTYLALVAVPILAAVALGWLTPGARRARVALVPVLFALAWALPGDLAGQASALALSALSCVTLGVLLAAVTPPRWLGAGIVAMAIADTALVVSDLLQRPNNALNAAHPAAGLPRLQSASLGSAVMGYGDLFVVAVLGALLVVAFGRFEQIRGAALVAAIALALDFLFFFVNELPATVPAALTLIAVLALRRRRSAAKAPALAPVARAAHRRHRGARDRGAIAPPPPASPDEPAPPRTVAP
jgi:hypothetical protein